MPKVFEWNGYKFFFYSNEGKPVERCHIHVRKGGNIAKYFVEPDVVLESSYGFNSSELKVLEKQIAINQELIRRKWDEYFGKRG